MEDVNELELKENGNCFLQKWSPNGGVATFWKCDR